VTHEAFRTLQTNGRPKPAPVFSFLNVPDEEEASTERVDLSAPANGEHH